MESTKLMQFGSTVFLGKAGESRRAFSEEYVELLGFLLTFGDGSGETLHSFRLTRQQLEEVNAEISKYLERSTTKESNALENQHTQAVDSVNIEKEVKNLEFVRLNPNRVATKQVNNPKLDSSRSSIPMWEASVRFDGDTLTEVRAFGITEEAARYALDARFRGVLQPINE
jgi:hypothetical protein